MPTDLFLSPFHCTDLQANYIVSVHKRAIKPFRLSRMILHVQKAAEYLLDLGMFTPHGQRIFRTSYKVRRPTH
jgi:hypothetical protein